MAFLDDDNISITLYTRYEKLMKRDEMRTPAGHTYFAMNDDTDEISSSTNGAINTVTIIRPLRHRERLISAICLGLTLSTASTAALKWHLPSISERERGLPQHK